MNRTATTTAIQSGRRSVGGTGIVWRTPANLYQDWGLGTGDWGLGTGDWGLGTGDWGLGTGDWGLGTGDWGLGKTPGDASRRESDIPGVCRSTQRQPATSTSTQPPAAVPQSP